MGQVDSGSVEPAAFASAALTVRKLSTLLRAGLSLGSAKLQLVDELDLLDSRVQDQLAKLATLSETYGSSLFWSLESLSNHYFQQAKLLRRITLTAAMPRTTAKLVAWLPIICLTAAQLFGLSPVNTILHNGIAASSAIIGLILLMLNRWFMGRLVASLELAASCGLAEITSFAEVSLALQAGMPFARLIELELPRGLLALLRLASESGASVAQLIQGELDIRSLDFVSQLELQAEKMQMKLLAPIGFLVLPALVFLAIIPTAVTLIAN